MRVLTLAICESGESLQNRLANVGESTQNCLANVGKSGESTNKHNRDVGECHKYVSARVLTKVHMSTHDKVCGFMNKKHILYV